MTDQTKEAKRTTVQAELRGCMETILGDYLNSRFNERFGKASCAWSEFTRATQVLRSSNLARTFPRSVFKWSIGQGNWANVPWIAALDSEETRKTSESIYVTYLFRADMSGVYLTLNQGTSSLMSGYTDSGAHQLRTRAALLRRRAAALEQSGFTVGEGVALRSNLASVRAYQDATIAFKFYERDGVPCDKTLFSDLESALKVYETLVPSRQFFG